MAKRGVKSLMMSNVPPELREKVDRDIITVLEFPGEKGAADRPRQYQDVYNTHNLQEYGVSIHSLKRYAQGVEVRHKLSARKMIAEAVAEEHTDLTPAMKKVAAAEMLDRMLDPEAELDTDDLASIARIADRFARTSLAESALRAKELDALFAKLSSNQAVQAFIQACESVFGDQWKEKREEVIRVMQEQLQKGAA